LVIVVVQTICAADWVCGLAACGTVTVLVPKRTDVTNRSRMTIDTVVMVVATVRVVEEIKVKVRVDVSAATIEVIAGKVVLLKATLVTIAEIVVLSVVICGRYIVVAGTSMVSRSVFVDSTR
jgi:hypothetical protein